MTRRKRTPVTDLYRQHEKIMLESALKYASLGWLVFPLHGIDDASPSKCSCWKEDCKQPGKHPRWLKNSLEHGNKDATDNQEIIKQWWDVWPEANIGIKTGAESGFIMIGPDGEDGVKQLAEIEMQHGEFLPQTPMAISGGGGRHYLFQHPGVRVPNRANFKGTKIDVRGDGGLFVAAPSTHKSGNRYSWESAPWDCEIATAPDWLIEWLEEKPKENLPRPNPVPIKTISSFGMSIEERARRLLRKRGPAVSRSRGHDHTFGCACLLVLGYNLTPDEAYPLLAEWNESCQPPWSEKELRHKLEDADKQPGERGYLLTPISDDFGSGAHVDLTAMLAPVKDVEDEIEQSPANPGNLSAGFVADHDGFISDVMRFTLANSLYPQPELALAGAIALMGTLAGRKVTDCYGTRTNCYVLGIAKSGAGKEEARSTNVKLLIANPQAKTDHLGPESVASGSGLVSAVKKRPSVLIQMDEIGRVISTTKNANKSPYLYQIVTELMKLYSKSGSYYTGSAYADSDRETEIDQPNLVLYGTTTPESFWDNITADNIGEGLLGRFMIFESPGYVDKVSAVKMEPPQELLDRVIWWVNLRANVHNGNLGVTAPGPNPVLYEPAAFERMEAHLLEISRKRKTERDDVAAIWSRTGEKTAKLALIFACSRATSIPFSINLDDVNIAIRLSNWMTRRMVFQAFERVSINEHEAKVKKVLQILGGTRMTQSQFVRKTQWLRKHERSEILESLFQGGQIAYDTVKGRFKDTAVIFRTDKVIQIVQETSK